MSRPTLTLIAALICAAHGAPALAQHRVDCILTLSPGLAAAPGAPQTIQTGYFLNVNDPAPTPIRVFDATLGSVAPNFTDTPGFDCLPGTFPVPTSNGFTILKTLRKWNGNGFDILRYPTDEHIQITYGPLGPVQSPDCDIATPGFTVQVGSNGEWHRHLEYTLTAPARTGIYLLKLQIYSTSAQVSPAKPIWFVFQQANAGDNPPADPVALQADQDAAFQWVTLHLVPQLCDADFNADGVLSVQDIFDFLAAWFAADPNADFNGDCTLSVQDIFDFLSAWFAGCPA